MSKECQTIIFSDKAYNAIIDETFRKDPIETGGILLGHVFDNGIWVVMEVIPPGIDSVHQYAYFEYDEKFVNYLAESVATKYENKLELLGLWHRHPGSMDTFSGTDDGTNRVFASLRSYGAISGLVNVDPKFRLTMRHVSNPLRYEIVDFEVGDDLIPEEYFKLRHFPEKGLNPSPDMQKKNDWRSIGSTYEPKSNSNSIKETTTIQTKKNNSGLLKTCILGVCALFFFILFLIVHSSQRIVEDHRLKKSTLYELIYKSTNDKGLCIINSKTIEITVKEGDKEIIATKTLPAFYINPTNAVSIVKYSLLVLCVLSLGLIFISFNQKKKLYLVFGSCVLALLVVILSPVNVSIAFFTYLILISLILIYIAIGAYKCFEVVNVYRHMPWYQKYKSLFFDEDQAIHDIEPNAERSFEEGKLVYTVITDRHITRQEHTLAYQMIYSSNYPDDGSIKIYFIMPDLDDMFTAENRLKSSYIKTDINGDKYLDFNSEIRKEMNGAKTIKYLYKWIDSYNRHRVGDISDKSEKI